MFQELQSRIPYIPAYSQGQNVPRYFILEAAEYNLCTFRTTVARRLNLLKPTGHVMHQQFDIQQLYALPTLYLCVLYLSENKQRLVPLTA